jgi:hypothetical protein
MNGTVPLHGVGRDEITFICHEENQDSVELSKGSNLVPGKLPLICIRKISASKFGRHTDNPN